jgi:hypothetical protein
VNGVLARVTGAPKIPFSFLGAIPLAGDADPKREGLMATPNLSSLNGDLPAADSLAADDQAKKRPPVAPDTEPEQGYEGEQAEAETALIDPTRLLPRFRDKPDLSLEQRNELLAEILRRKLEHGYEIESQTETEAILVTRRRRWSGILGSKPDTRQSTSIDEKGHTSTRTL